MTSSQLILALSGLFALAIGQCPPGNCPPPTDPDFCGPPDCSIPTNRYHQNALFPVQNDAESFWQCYPSAPGVWTPIARRCACGSWFNVNVFPRRCTFWWELNWAVPPMCNWPNPPPQTPCDPWCPNCPPDDPQITPPPDTTTLPPPPTPGPWDTTTPGPGPGDPLPTTTTVETTTTRNECGCPPGCPPCIWWPCLPCVPCWCQQQNQQQQPRSPWQ